MSLLERLFQPDVLAALKTCKVHLAAAALFSLAINVLYLAVPIYMLQVYDRVLASGSLATLAMLSLALVAAIATLAALDYVRSAVLARSGVRLENRLAAHVLESLVARANLLRGAERGQALRDLDQFRQSVSGAAIITLFDAPWAPIFIAAAFLVHVSLGMFALACGAILLSLAVANEHATRRPLGAATEAGLRNYEFTDATLRNAEVIHAMGMLPGLAARWQAQRRALLEAQLAAAGRGAGMSSLIRFLRIVMQSLMLGLGAWLAIERAITPGQMFAATILLGRALQPVEQAVGTWRQLVAAWAAAARVGRLLATPRTATTTVPLPRPLGRLTIERATFVPPGAREPILRDIQVAVEPGSSVAVIGPTAAGKSTLARLVVGVHVPTAGAVRLDGADVHAWPRDDFGRHVGYLPQDIELFAGSIAENIARFAPDAGEAVVAAAMAADAHDMILRLPQGYDTQVGEAGVMLSPGQRQRVGLARALFGNPALVVLDEPNSNLDTEGDEALEKALANLKAAGRTVLIVTHRIAILRSVDRLLALRGGMLLAWGTPQEVMAKLQPQAAAPLPPRVPPGVLRY